MDYIWDIMCRASCVWMYLSCNVSLQSVVSLFLCFYTLIVYLIDLVYVEADCCIILIHVWTRVKNMLYTGWPNKNGTVDTVKFSGLCSDHQLCFSPCWIEHFFPHYNNTKIIKLVENLLVFE